MLVLKRVSNGVFTREMKKNAWNLGTGLALACISSLSTVPGAPTSCIMVYVCIYIPRLILRARNSWVSYLLGVLSN